MAIHHLATGRMSALMAALVAAAYLSADTDPAHGTSKSAILAQKGNDMLSMTTILATGLYAGIGILIFIISFVLVDFITPQKLWQEIIEKQNMAVAFLAGSVAIGLSFIIAAAIHG